MTQHGSSLLARCITFCEMFYSFLGVSKLGQPGFSLKKLESHRQCYKLETTQTRHELLPNMHHMGLSNDVHRVGLTKSKSKSKFNNS